MAFSLKWIIMSENKILQAGDQMGGNVFLQKHHHWSAVLHGRFCPFEMGLV